MNSLEVSRTVKASRTQVWQVWTDPDQLIAWWGPDGFTNTFHEIAVRPGGIWKLTMHGPDGTDYPNEIRFEELVAPERIVYFHAANAQHPSGFRMTVTFTQEASPMTRITMTATFPTAAEMEAIRAGFLEGSRQCLGRMAARVMQLNPAEVAS